MINHAAYLVSKSFYSQCTEKGHLIPKKKSKSDLYSKESLISLHRVQLTVAVCLMCVSVCLD